MKNKKSIKKQVSNNIKRFQTPKVIISKPISKEVIDYLNEESKSGRLRYVPFTETPKNTDDNYGFWAFIALIVLGIILMTIPVKNKQTIQPINICPPPVVQTESNITVIHNYHFYENTFIPYRPPSHWYDCLKYKPQPLPPAKKVYPVLIKQ